MHMRSTILPVPYAFSKIGILVGSLTMLLVASVNDATCCMLIRCVLRSSDPSPSGMDCGGIVLSMRLVSCRVSAATGLYSYEELAEWAGGKRAKVKMLPL